MSLTLISELNHECKKMIKLLFANLIIYLASISSVYAFTCYDSTGNVLDSLSGTATANVYVNLQPSVQAGQNLVVDLSRSIFVATIVL